MLSNQLRPAKSKSPQARGIILLVLVILAIVAWRLVLQSPTPARPVPLRRLASIPSTPEATRIIAQTAKVYGSCRSYQDAGSVTTTIAGRPQFDSIKPFQTVFVRPDRFYFTYKTIRGVPKDHYIVWATGKQIHSWWSQEPGINNYTNLEDAMKRPRAFSGGSGQTIPRLLLPQLGGWSLKELTGVRLVDTEPIAGVVCYKLEGSNKYHDTVTVWIAKESYLILKLLQVGQIQGAEARTAEVFTPQINKPVNEEVFTSGPPKA
ncbi:MAG TPA: DUF2092 domain-containing protein [Chthonomonadaceae bacterium]|nr:DUF2092 domain-containing protein [Chthonomonadaceae bacterium]